MSSISNGVNSAPLPSPTGVIFFASSFIESLVSILLLLLILISILPIDVDNNDVLLLLLLEEVEVGILVLFGEIYGKGGKPLLRDDCDCWKKSSLLAIPTSSRFPICFSDVVLYTWFEFIYIK